MKIFYGDKKVPLMYDAQYINFRDFYKDLFLIATYKFDKSVYENLIPDFNSGFMIDSKIVDTVENNIVTRSIYAESYPTMIRFGSDNSTNKTLSLKEIDYLNTSNLTTCEKMFSNCANATKISTTDWNTSKVTNMAYMFNNCSSLTALYTNKFDTTKVTDMSYMFYNCNKVASLNIASWNTGAVKKFTAMFSNCTALTSLSVSNFNTANATDISYMFSNCALITTLDVSTFNTANVKNMEGLFNNCFALATLTGLNKFNTAKVTNMKKMFGSAYKLTSLDLSTWNVSNVTNMTEMFADDTASNSMTLASLNISNWKLNASSDYTDMFKSSNKVKTVTMKNSDVASVNKIVDVLLTKTSSDKGTLDITGISDLSQIKVETAESKYWSIKDVRLITTYKFNKATYSNLVPEFDNNFSVDYRIVDSTSGDIVTRTIYNYGYPTKIQFGQTWIEGESGATAKSQSLISVEKLLTINLTTCADMFRQCRNLSSVKTTGWNTANVTSMAGMFADCRALATLDVSVFNTAKVVDMSGMFWNCQALTSLTISTWNTSKVTNMGNMFNGCLELTILTLSNFNTAAVTNMNNMFANCKKLTSLSSVSNFNMTNVVNAYQMFKDCNAITSLDLSSWNVSNITNMYQMFYNSDGLKSLNLSNWTLNANVNLSEIFDATPLNSITMNNSDNKSIDKIVKKLPDRDTQTTGAITVTNTTDLYAETWQDATYKNWTINTDFLAARFRYNRSVKSNTIPIFDSTVTSYSIRDDLPGDLDEGNVLDENYRAYLYKINDGLCFLAQNKETGINILIDCAEENKAVNSGVLTHMKNVLGVTKIDHLIITHFHSDHVGGFRDFAAQFEIGKVYYKAIKTNLLPELEITWRTDVLYEEALQICATKGIPTKVITENFEVPEAGFKILAGDMSDNYNNYNGQSLGVTLTMNNRKIFVAGDLITRTELMILDDFEECDALIIGHHGYANSNCPEMLNIINAKHYFVPTYGTSGDDHAEINARIALYSTNYFSTHNNGERITMYFDDKGFFHDAIYKVNGTVVGDTEAVEDSVIRNVYTKVHPKQVCFYVSDTDKNGSSVQEVQFVDTNALTIADNMFKGCSALIRLSCSNWKMSKVVSAKNMFDCCNRLSLIDVTNWDVSNITDMSAMFYYCTSIRTLNLSGWNTNKCTNMQWMFSRAWYIDEIIGINDLDVSNVTNMNSMFFYVGAYNLDLSKWDTGKVTDMSYMFSDCWRMTTLNVTGWDTSNVTNMYTMFGYYEYGSPALTTVTGLNTWNVSKVTNMYQLFWECRALQSIDISGWNLASCANFSWSFCDCTSLTTFKADGVKIPSACTIVSMFASYRYTGCGSLKTVSIKNSDSTTVNKFIDVLPTRTSSNKGSLTITGINGTANTTTATSKYWAVTN